METQVLVWSIFATSVGGFFFLLRLNINANNDLKKELKHSNDSLLVELKKITIALVGDYDKKGIKTKVEQNEWHIADIKKKCDLRHEIK